MSVIALMIEYLKLLARWQETTADFWTLRGPDDKEEETKEEHDYEIVFARGEAYGYKRCAQLLLEYLEAE